MSAKLRPASPNVWTRDRVAKPSNDRAALRKSYPEVAERIAYLAGLEPDWDGYGAGRISPAAVDKCVRLLNAIDPDCYSRAGQPFVAPMADGGLELEWEPVHDRELMLVIPPDGTTVRFLLTSFDPTGHAEDQAGVLSEESDINEWLASSLS